MLELCIRCSIESEDPSPAPALLDWKTVHSQIPWNVMLLLGGGFALADGCKVGMQYLNSFVGVLLLIVRNACISAGVYAAKRPYFLTIS